MLTNTQKTSVQCTVEEGVTRNKNMRKACGRHVEGIRKALRRCDEGMSRMCGEEKMRRHKESLWKA